MQGAMQVNSWWGGAVCQCGSWAHAGAGAGGYKEGFRRLSSANLNLCGVKMGEICRLSTATVPRRLVFSVIRTAGVLCRAGHWELSFLQLRG